MVPCIPTKTQFYLIVLSLLSVNNRKQRISLVTIGPRPLSAQDTYTHTSHLSLSYIPLVFQKQLTHLMQTAFWLVVCLWTIQPQCRCHLDFDRGEFSTFVDLHTSLQACCTYTTFAFARIGKAPCICTAVVLAEVIFTLAVHLQRSGY